MPREKLRKFRDIRSFSNVLEFPGEIKEKWRRDYFKNDGAIVLELACGKGAYTLAMGEMFSDKNFIGVDRKGERIWKGAKMALDNGMSNVAFLRVFIESLEDYFAKGEVDGIWITFPDPFPKEKHEKRRLTAPHMLEVYSRILKPGGLVHLKTDSDCLYNYTIESMNGVNCEVIDACDDIYAQKEIGELLEIKTDFERSHLLKGRTIKYVVGRF